MTIYRKKLGQAGETYAIEYLQANGYQIITTNFSTRYGEIDIIAREKGYLVFLEVKTRTNRKFGDGLSAISTSKKQHIIRAALNYIVRHKLHHENCRFDLLALDTTPEGKIIDQKLIKDAIQVDRRYRI